MISRIRSNAPWLVKWAPLTALLCGLVAPGASLAQDPHAAATGAPAPDANGGPGNGNAPGAPADEPKDSTGSNNDVVKPAAPGPSDEALPEITARSFAVKIVRHSSSGKTYLFDDVTEAKTRTGKILLLRRESEPIMAFRVVKTYPDKKQFAAKRVRRYPGHRVLDGGDQFDALEKVGDLIPPPQTAQDKADLKELENGPGGPGSAGGTPTPTAPPPDVQSYDPDLDSGSSPPPSGGVDSENSKDSFKDEDEEDSHLGMTVDEVIPLDPNSQWLTATFGFMRNTGADGNAAYFTGGGVRYGLTLGHMVFLRRAHVQDSIVAEGGVFFYKILNFVSSNDAYSVMPVIADLRYNIQFGESFAIFFYGGMEYNKVTSTSQADPTVADQLARSYPAGGGGLLFRVGPSWDMRVDLGYDILGLGLVLRF